LDATVCCWMWRCAVACDVLLDVAVYCWMWQCAVGCVVPLILKHHSPSPSAVSSPGNRNCTLSNTMESSPTPMKELWLACVPFVRRFPLCQCFLVQACCWRLHIYNCSWGSLKWGDYWHSWRAVSFTRTLVHGVCEWVSEWVCFLLCASFVQINLHCGSEDEGDKNVKGVPCENEG